MGVKIRPVEQNGVMFYPLTIGDAVVLVPENMTLQSFLNALPRPAYGVCTTAAATATKEVTLASGTQWKLVPGAEITVKFSDTNTAETPYLKVGNTAAKRIWYNTALIGTTNLGYAGTADRPMKFVYDGTQYVFMGWSHDGATITDINMNAEGDIIVTLET